MQNIYLKKNDISQCNVNNAKYSVYDSSSQGESLQRKADLTNNAAQRAAIPRPNNTGMPDNLKAGIESLSGFSMDDVRVHYNSSKPATVQALAYTQGTDIHVAPGQEKHLPHEAWHVAQQMAGRVSPTTNINGMPVNDNAALEHEADVMGEKAVSQNVDVVNNLRFTMDGHSVLQGKFIYKGKIATVGDRNDLERIRNSNVLANIYSDANGNIYDLNTQGLTYNANIFMANHPDLYYFGSLNDIVDAVVRIANQIYLKGYQFDSSKTVKMALYYIYQNEFSQNDRDLNRQNFDQNFLQLLQNKVEKSNVPIDFTELREIYRDTNGQIINGVSSSTNYFFVYRTMSPQEFAARHLLVSTGRAGDFTQACSYSGITVKFRVEKNGNSIAAAAGPLTRGNGGDAAPLKSESRGQDLIPMGAAQYSYNANDLWRDVASGNAKVVGVMYLGK